MKNIQVITTDFEVLETVAASFSDEFEVVRTSTLAEALAYVQKNRCDFLFIDMTILKKPPPKAIIRQTSAFLASIPNHRGVRDDATKTAAGGCKGRETKFGKLSHLPRYCDEIKLAIQNITDQNIVQSELTHLRGQIWED